MAGERNARRGIVQEDVTAFMRQRAELAHVLTFGRKNLAGADIGKEHGDAVDFLAGDAGLIFHRLGNGGPLEAVGLNARADSPCQ